MKNFISKFIIFIKKYWFGFLLITLSAILIIVLSKHNSKSIKNILATDYSKNDSDIILFKDSLIREYVKIDVRKDSLQNIINNLLKENKSLSLQTSLLKFKQNRLKEYEKNIPYINDKNTTIDSAIITINRVVTKYPIEVHNR